MDDAESENAARTAAAFTARKAYGRILSILAAHTHDIAEAEDALAEAFARALETWPETGPPQSPEAWLLTTARNVLSDQTRRMTTRTRNRQHLLILIEESEAQLSHQDTIPDKRLGLMFVCAHPSVDPAMQTPLMLQTVLGLDAARIAAAFLVKPATMGQRLSRQKSRLRDQGVGFDIPDRDEWPARLGAVLQTIYAVYTSGWDDHEDNGLVEEALFLARLVSSLLPYEPEAAGLLALILHSEARRSARRDESGAFIPLDEQETALWDHTMIAEAERLVGAALRTGQPGRFQYEAAIQSAHNARAATGHTDWQAILAIYNRLLSATPSLGAAIGRAAALSRLVSPQQALADLDQLPAERIASYQPYWATRAYLEKEAGQRESARLSYQRAAGLTADPAVRRYLLEQCATL